MGRPEQIRRLLLHEALLPLYKSRGQNLSNDARKDFAQRQSSHVLGTRKIRSQTPHAENRQKSLAPKNQHGRRTRRRLRPLRLPPRNRLGLRLRPVPTQNPFLTSPPCSRALFAFVGAGLAPPGLNTIAMSPSVAPAFFFRPVRCTHLRTSSPLPCKRHHLEVRFRQPIHKNPKGS